MTGPEHLIAARRARADATRHRADKALAKMIRAREPITFTTVASRAGVSREYLYRTPELAQKIRAARSTPKAAVAAVVSADSSIIAALRDHLRRQQEAHEQEVRALRSEIVHLRHELEAALGRLLADETASSIDRYASAQTTSLAGKAKG